MSAKPEFYSPLDLSKLSTSVVQKSKDLGIMLSTAESCTGGLVSAHITAVAGSSAVFDRSFITYSYASKVDMLGVNLSYLQKHGAVSEVVALEMLKGALKNSAAHISVAITGIAGPTGGSKDKPVGTICFAWGDKDNSYASTEYFSGDREAVRNAAVAFALQQLITFM